jgi:lipopolysaccharide/colanic/teichoic acid biosynthesis glycosyltransferase
VGLREVGELRALSSDPKTSQSVNEIVGSNGRPTLKVAPISRGLYARLFKPVFDRVIGLALLVLTLPILIAAAIAIRLKIGSPILYTQDRVGVNGDTFNLYKFRTMIPDRRQANGGFEGSERRVTHKSPEDPRVLPLGKTLRSFRLDELPQFWNVVNGDMSLVGPRPELPEIVAEYEDWQHGRHDVKPGVTGPWQISERNGKAMHECTETDIEYIEDVRFSTDLSILARTPIAMIGGRRGY